MWLRSSTVIAVGVILLVSCCEIGESKGGGGRGGGGRSSGGRGGSRGGSRGGGGGGSYSGSGGSGYTGSAPWVAGLISGIIFLVITICVCVCVCHCYKKPAIGLPAHTTGTVINTPTQVSTIAETNMFSGAGKLDTKYQPPPYTTDSGARGAHHLSHTDIQPPPQYSANGYHTRPPPYKARDSISSVTHQ